MGEHEHSQIAGKTGGNLMVGGAWRWGSMNTGRFSQSLSSGVHACDFHFMHMYIRV